MQHSTQASGSWYNLSLLEQLANVGSEVERTIKWKEKGNEEYSKLAFFRSLELFNLTLCTKEKSYRLKEVARAKELWIDFAYFDNEYKTTAEFWRKYFNWFLLRLRVNQ